MVIPSMKCILLTYPFRCFSRVRRKIELLIRSLSHLRKPFHLIKQFHVPFNSLKALLVATLQHLDVVEKPFSQSTGRFNLVLSSRADLRKVSPLTEGVLLRHLPSEIGTRTSVNLANTKRSTHSRHEKPSTKFLREKFPPVYSFRDVSLPKRLETISSEVNPDFLIAQTASLIAS